MSSPEQASPSHSEIFHWGWTGHDSEQSSACTETLRSSHSYQSDTESDTCVVRDTDSMAAQPPSPDFAPPHDENQDTETNQDDRLIDDDQQSNPPPLTNGTTDPGSEDSPVTGNSDRQQPEEPSQDDGQPYSIQYFLSDPTPTVPLMGQRAIP